ncbi:MAG: tetratricopeptide repeat protein, partial [Crocinitomicaceae bacterium]
MKLLLFLLVFLQAYLVFSNRIDKAFESLNRKDYYTAHKLFQKSIKKQESISAFGLTQLYLRHDYQNLDSAYRYILISESSFGSLNTKDRLKFSKFQFDSLAIQSWKQLVSDELFEEILNTPTEISLQKFIDQNSWSNQLGKAILLRDSISFFEMKALNTSQLTHNFLAKYPNSIYSKPANSLLQDQQFEESTRSGMLSDYEKFVNDYPENKHYVDAENRIYELATKTADLNAFKQFISKYPKNRNINDAWR